MHGFRIRNAAALVACLALGGCIGYGYPGGDYGDAYGGSQAYPAYPGTYPGRTFRCESHDRKRTHCAADTRYGVDIVRRISDAPCVQGRTWGWDGYGVWVDDGCRADFAVGGHGGSRRPGGGYGQGRVVRCESRDKRYARCNVPVRQGVQLQRKLSDSSCNQGPDWGWDRQGLWVDNGCRADFLVY
ncbi:MAG: DUF3011 domain-containing protein [Thermomonas sp.]